MTLLETSQFTAFNCGQGSYLIVPRNSGAKARFAEYLGDESEYMAKDGSYQWDDQPFSFVEAWDSLTKTSADGQLIQFQCQKEGSIFYYQHDRQTARSIVGHCPVCGSKRVKETGRGFNSVDENKPIDIDIDNWS